MRISSPGVREIVELSRSAGFTLPARLVTAYETIEKLSELRPERDGWLDRYGAADVLIAQVETGADVDLVELAREVEAGEDDRVAHDTAISILNIAREQAVDRCNSVARGLSEEIIESHLLPQWEAIFEEAREYAPKIHGHSLKPSDLYGESEKARQARAAHRKLEPLAIRRRLIMKARYRANTLGFRESKHDDGMFASLRNPMALAPGWKIEGTSPFPRQVLSPPETEGDQPVAELLWWVVDAAAAEPWLPTIAQADERHLEVFAVKAATHAAVVKRNRALEAALDR